MLPAVNARKLQHQSHFTWQSRYAPRCSGDELPPASWRERASKHRERCPVLQGHRPPRPPHVKYVPKELPTAEQVDLEPLDFLPAPPESLEDDADGDCFGVLSRVELSRYIARRSAILVRTQQSGQGASVESGSDRLEMSTESFCLKEVDIPWKVILDALSFERMQLRRGFSNQWPDALWSPACLNREAVTELECKLTKCIREIEELADAQDCVRSSLQAMPLGVLLRHLLCDARIAVGDLSCAAKALWGAVTPEAGADPLQPPLLIVWENCLNCNYLKAQQCLRFGRLAILAAAQSLVAAQVAKVEAYTEELRHRREAQHVDRARRALRSMLQTLLNPFLTMRDTLTCFSCGTAIRSTWEAMDLRFASAENEAAFQSRMQSHPLHPPFLASFVGVVHVALQLSLMAMFLFSDEATLCGENVPGTYFLLQGVGVVFMGAISVASLLKEIRRCSLSLEILWVGALFANIVAGFFQTRQGLFWLGTRIVPACMDTWRDLEISAVLLTVFVSIGCHVLPIRCYYLWPLVGLAMGSCFIQAIGAACRASEYEGLATASKLLNGLLVFFLLSSSYGAAHCTERRRREEWLKLATQEQILVEALAKKELSKVALARDLKIFRVYGCCLVFGLLEDLRVSIGSCRSAQMVFGKNVAGHSFLSLIAEEDREKFSALCQRSDGSKIPRSMALKLIVQDVPTTVRVLVVHHGHAGKDFLVGIRMDLAGWMEDPEKSLKPLERREDLSVQPVIPSPHKPEPPEIDLAVHGQLGPTLQSPRNTNYSGFSSDDNVSDAGLSYTESRDENSGFSSVLLGIDEKTQTDAWLGQTDHCVETETWDGFRCKCGNHPEQPLTEQQRAMIACRDLRPKRHRRKSASSLESLSGTWALESQFIGIAQTFMHRLTIVGDRCVDACGQKWKLTQEGNNFFFIKGRMWINGGVLFREGKSGIVMRFRREEEMQDDFEFDLEEQEQELESSSEEEEEGEEEEEQDSLQVLENMVSEVYWDH
ncbi:unnamed protein product [Durusdinium trenchii]|uniref:Uncharacterized protein n=1 Tax=Durusdinium trenchii TaxID=1381693 RepID=A0ABP0L2B4_9DINO